VAARSGAWVIIGLAADWFRPAWATSERTGTTARRQVDHFITMLMVIGAFSTLSALGQLAQGLWASGTTALVGLLLAALWLLLLRQGAPLPVLVASFLTLGASLAVGFALATGPNGLVALCWLGLLPPLTLALSGPRGAAIAFAVGVPVVAACVGVMFGIDYQPPMSVPHPAFAHAVSLLGLAASLYVLARGQWREAEEDVRALEQRNRELDQARAAADAGSLAKGQFLARMSHEIRTPMNGVLGMTSVILGDPGVPEAVRLSLQIIEQSGATLLAVINDILDVSKLEAGRFEMEAVPVDLRAALSGVAALLEHAALAQRTSLSVVVADDVPAWILGDPVRLRQVILNLLANAVKFTQAGTVQVTVARRGSRLELRVRDTGIGMTPSQLKGLFQPFSQAEASTARRYGGTGLGLAIVHGLVELMGGEVSVLSNLGLGSEFTVTLPLVEAEPPRNEPTPAPAPATRLRVLVVDDNPVNLLVAKRLVQQLGHEVVLAENGAEAMRCVDAGPLDLVLMDCQMPLMDGFEATRAIRAGPASGLPVVALTASALPEERQRCLDSGMDEMLTKPVQRRDLEELLRRLPDLRPGGAAALSARTSSPRPAAAGG
jgi:signal transduction histidine kinase/ActR/RegA family two-component response regulator